MRLLIDCHCFDFEISQGITTYIQGIYSELPDLAQDIEFSLSLPISERLREFLEKGKYSLCTSRIKE